MQAFLSALHQHRWLFLFGALYVLAVTITAFLLGATWAEFADVISYFRQACLFLLFFPMFILVAWLALAFARTFDRNPIKWLQRAFEVFDRQVVTYFQSDQFWSGVVAIFAILPINMFFCVGKSLIRHVADYTWDPMLASADKALHFGHYPHELITPFIENYNLSDPVNFLYLLWFIVLFGIQGYCAFCDTDKVSRMRYLWSTLFCWSFLGTICAMLLASVGPAFYADYYPKEISPYAQMLAHLKETHPNLEVVILGPAMLEIGHNDKIVNINALSAMPSLHVAIAFLSVLYFWNKNRAAFLISFVYFLVILAGSVYLGWHYALDGYVATILVWVIWASTKPLVAKLHPKWMQQKDA